MSGFASTRVTLLLRLRERTDELSWHDFHDRYGELLLRYARKRGASAVDAEDIVQEVEMYLFKAMEGFEYNAAKGRFRSYLRSAVIHAMGRRAAKEAKQGIPLDPHDFDHLAASRGTSEDAQWEHEWRMHRLRWALRSIAGEFEENTLQAFRLHVLAGQPVARTAEATGLSPDSVYQAKSRILKRLRDRLLTLDPDNDV